MVSGDAAGKARKKSQAVALGAEVGDKGDRYRAICSTIIQSYITEIVCKVVV